jgi:hypothetical protein
MTYAPHEGYLSDFPDHGDGSGLFAEPIESEEELETNED